MTLVLSRSDVLELLSFAVAALLVTAAVLVLWRPAPLKVMAAGAVFGILRTQPWVK